MKIIIIANNYHYTTFINQRIITKMHHMKQSEKVLGFKKYEFEKPKEEQRQQSGELFWKWAICSAYLDRVYLATTKVVFPNKSFSLFATHHTSFAKDITETQMFFS